MGAVKKSTALLAKGGAEKRLDSTANVRGARQAPRSVEEHEAKTADFGAKNASNDWTLLGSGCGGFSHARGPFGGAALHFVRRDVFDVRGHAPAMAERVG